MALRNYIVDNFWWKLLSLLLAALTWLTVRTQFEREQTLQDSPVLTPPSVRNFPALPITLMTSPFNTNRYRLEPSMVSVEVSGTVAELEKLREKEIHIYVNLTDVGEEKQVRRKIEAQTPNDVKITGLSQIFANVERISGSKASQTSTNLTSP